MSEMLSFLAIFISQQISVRILLLACVSACQSPKHFIVETFQPRNGQASNRRAENDRARLLVQCRKYQHLT